MQYKFTDDETFYTCYMSFSQYLNFRNLSIIKECRILKRNQKGYAQYIQEMQNAIDMLVRNDRYPLKKLSWPKHPNSSKE